MNGTTGFGSKLQLGPNWKIYAGANPMIDPLHCINHPTWPGLACDFQNNAVYLQGNTNNQFHVYPPPGNYTIKLFVRHIDNRIDSATKIIVIHPKPFPDLGADQIICDGDSVTFDAGFFSGSTYQWSNLTANLPNIGEPPYMAALPRYTNGRSTE